MQYELLSLRNECDANAAAESAGILADHAAKLPEKFPEGSAGQPSEARKEIWDKWEEFADSANGLAESAAAFKAAAPGGIGAVSVFKEVYIDRRELKCACVGGDSNVPLGFISLTENLMMIAMAVWMMARTQFV